MPTYPPPMYDPYMTLVRGSMVVWWSVGLDSDAKGPTNFKSWPPVLCLVKSVIRRHIEGP